jgi:hypothetical protein
MNSQTITIKIVAPDTHQLLRSLRAIENLNPLYVEGQIKQNDKDSGCHCFLTLPVDWFRSYENKLIEADAAQNSHELNRTATANPELIVNLSEA